MGIGNEVQGIVLDVQRWWNNRPMGAFQMSDLASNERGFSCAQAVAQGFSATCVQCCSGECSNNQNNYGSISAIYQFGF
ncbi:MAG: hypothetical protein ACKVQW_08710 [Pyrinomonadaceae bacterium]